MKSPIFIGLFLAAMLSASAADVRKVFEKDPIPEAGFVDDAALRQWSASSSFGGGWSEKLELADQNVYWTMRSVTSGRATAEIVFWTKKKDRLLPCLIMPLRYAEYRVVLEEQDVVMKCWDDTGRDFREVMRLKASFFRALP